MIQGTDGVCPIWATPARTFRSSSFNWTVDSPRAGGAYMIDILTMNQVKWSPPLQASISTWIIDEHRAGQEWPVVTTDVVQMVAGRRPLRLSERIDRFFLYLSVQGYRPGSSINLSDDEVARTMLAWTESLSAEEFMAFRNVLISMQLVEPLSGDIMLKPAGYDRLEQVEQRHVATHQAFIAMWFGDDVQSAYEDGIAPAVADSGYMPFRIDRKEHANKIDDEIVAEIKRSRFVVADFTCPLIEGPDGKVVPNARGGVYYEAGLAQGLGIPVLWAVNVNCLDYVHFDTRQFAHIVWKDPDDLRVRLTNRIRAVIGNS
jgi:hypothetical protein